MSQNLKNIFILKTFVTRMVTPPDQPCYDNAKIEGTTNNYACFNYANWCLSLSHCRRTMGLLWEVLNCLRFLMRFRLESLKVIYCCFIVHTECWSSSYFIELLVNPHYEIKGKVSADIVAWNIKSGRCFFFCYFIHSIELKRSTWIEHEICENLSQKFINYRNELLFKNDNSR